MSSVWEFVKRHRGKIVVGAVAVGSVYALQRFVASREAPLAECQHDSVDKIQLQARRHYVYDTNQRACDSSIVELIACLRKRIELRFDVDSLTTTLQQRGGTLTAEQRIAMWHDIKTISIGRVVAVAYAFSLLSASLKCQMSILASHICSTFSCQQTSSWSRYVPSYLSMMLCDDSSKANPKRELDATTQQIFLKCIQYFTTEGLVELLNRVEEVSRAELSELDLKAQIDSTSLRNIFANIKQRMDNAEKMNFSRFVIPKYANQGACSSVGGGCLDELLCQFVDALESCKCAEVLSSLVDFYLHAAVSYVWRGSSKTSLPLARVLPLVANGFKELSSVVVDSPLQNSLCSTELHQLAMHVFSSPSPAFVN